MQTKPDMFRKIVLLASLVAVARANGGVYYLSLNEETTNNPDCAAVVTDCVRAGYNFIYDAHGNVAFASLWEGSTCDAYVGAATGSEHEGTLQAASLSGAVHFEGTYANKQLRIPVSTTGCAVVLDVQTFMPNAFSGALSYESNNGHASCVTTDCQLSGYNYVTDESNVMVFASRSATFCPLAAGFAHQKTWLTMTKNVDRLVATDINASVEGVFGDDGRLVVTVNGECAYTYARALSTDTTYLAQAAQQQGAFMSGAANRMLLVVVFVLYMF